MKTCKLGLQKEIEQLIENSALFVVKNRLDIVREDYRECPDVLTYLDEVQMHIVENVADLKVHVTRNP